MSTQSMQQELSTIEIMSSVVIRRGKRLKRWAKATYGVAALGLGIGVFGLVFYLGTTTGVALAVVGVLVGGGNACFAHWLSWKAQRNLDEALRLSHQSKQVRLQFSGHAEPNGHHGLDPF